MVCFHSRFHRGCADSDPDWLLVKGVDVSLTDLDANTTDFILHFGRSPLEQVLNFGIGPQSKTAVPSLAVNLVVGRSTAFTSSSGRDVDNAHFSTCSSLMP